MKKEPKIFIRLGTHAEKEYIEKTAKYLDGLIVGANLLESTPAATASLLLKLCGEKEPTLSYVIDPMTYAFGSYTDPKSGKYRNDLDWIFSDQLRKPGPDGKKTVVRALKRSYKSLGSIYGGLIEDATKNSKAVNIESLLSGPVRADLCDSVCGYQAGRMIDIFSGDDILREYVKHIPKPWCIIAPYFYIDAGDFDRLLEINYQLMASAASKDRGAPVYGLLAVDKVLLKNRVKLLEIAHSIKGTGVTGIWLWFSKFSEHDATEIELENYKHLVFRLSELNVDVLSMHGSYFSLALSNIGLSGVSHGVGYGEQKDVIPIIGQSTPTVQYYLWGVRKKLSVVQIQRAFGGMEIRTPEDFHKRVCDCVVCKGVIAGSLDNFKQFGEMHYSTSDAQRKSQTPGAAKRCRYHFLLRRFQERDWIREHSLAELSDELRSSGLKWAEQVSIRSEANHLRRWIEVLAR